MIAIAWTPREPPLAPVGVAAWGPAAARLADRLRACTDEQLASWTGVRAEGLLVVLGDDLPWVDGALWLGRDAAAPGLLLPTSSTSEVPIELLARALARFGSPLAVIPELKRVVPLISARPLARERLP